MHALVNALSNVTPWRWSCVSPGRFSWVQPSGKCWIARSWSVMNMTTFIPARFAGGVDLVAACAAPVASPPSQRPPAVIAERFRNLRRETPCPDASGGVMFVSMAVR